MKWKYSIVFYMGLHMSKNKKINIANIKIDDYSKVKIPKDYTLIKMTSYNISLNHTVNIDQKIKEIISYIMSKFNNKTIDIINLQEINDSISLHIFINEFKKYCLQKKLTYYFSPQYNNIGPSVSKSPTSSANMIEISFGSTGRGSLKHDEKKRKIIQNVIISKFPILSTTYTELDDNTDMDDILGIQTVVGANILIGNAIISVYNINLSKDIKAAQIINRDVRKIELNTLLNTINVNNKSLNADAKFDKYKKSGIHIIAGTFNILELEQQDNSINDEYKELLSNMHLIDIFRILAEGEAGFTTIFKERLNYIFFHMTEDFYKADSDYFNNIIKNKDVKVLINNLFKRYKINFFDYYTLSNDSDLSIYFPIECTFIVPNL